MFCRQIFGLVVEFLPPTVRALFTPERAPAITAVTPSRGRLQIEPDKNSEAETSTFKKLNSSMSNFLTIAL